MTATMPLVRTPAGAVLGPDFRQVPGLARPGYEVPGLIPADGVQPGDTVLLGAVEYVVLSARRHGTPGVTYLVVRTPGGAEIAIERRESERVRVVATGAFER